MYVGLLQLVFELPSLGSLKDKRSFVAPLKAKLIQKYKVSCAEIDLLDSLTFAHLGMAVVSNEKQFCTKVLTSITSFLEEEAPGRIHDLSTHIEQY